MIEIPEAISICRQMQETLVGKTIVQAKANFSPHKFAWYIGDPQEYGEKLVGKTFNGCKAQSGMIEMHFGDMRVVLGDGAIPRYYSQNEKHPAKHQLQLLFADGSGLYVSIAMYGGIWAFKEGSFDNPYYLKACQAVSPLSHEFDYDYFKQIDQAQGKLSVKAFLATEQRIPGLGNGSLQDILWKAGVHPKRKVANMSESEFQKLFRVLKETLAEMANLGGRDIENDLFGQPGGYQTTMSKNGIKNPCPHCGDTIIKEAYMGGSVYYCPTCQPLENFKIGDSPLF